MKTIKDFILLFHSFLSIFVITKSKDNYNLIKRSMSIQGDINELRHISAEIKSLNRRFKTLRMQKKATEKRIDSYLREKEQPGVKYKGIAVTIEERSRRVYKNKKSKQSDGRYVLEKYGIDNSDEVLEELLEAMRGSPRRRTIVKMTKIKNY